MTSEEMRQWAAVHGQRLASEEPQPHDPVLVILYCLAAEICERLDALLAEREVEDDE